MTHKHTRSDCCRWIMYSVCDCGEVTCLKTDLIPVMTHSLAWTDSLKRRILLHFWNSLCTAWSRHKSGYQRSLLCVYSCHRCLLQSARLHKLLCNLLPIISCLQQPAVAISYQLYQEFRGLAVLLETIKEFQIKLRCNTDVWMWICEISYCSTILWPECCLSQSLRVHYSSVIRLSEHFCLFEAIKMRA